jgi:hypothetical protein
MTGPNAVQHGLIRCRSLGYPLIAFAVSEAQLISLLLVMVFWLALLIMHWVGLKLALKKQNERGMVNQFR